MGAELRGVAAEGLATGAGAVVWAGISPASEGSRVTKLGDADWA
jgi:hypothetical protein